MDPMATTSSKVTMLQRRTVPKTTLVVHTISKEAVALFLGVICVGRSFADSEKHAQIGSHSLRMGKFTKIRRTQ